MKNVCFRFVLFSFGFVISAASVILRERKDFVDCTQSRINVGFESFFFCFHPFFFSKLRILVSEGYFYCVHTIRFSEPTKIGFLKSDRVNGPVPEYPPSVVFGYVHHGYMRFFGNVQNSFLKHG